MNWLKKLDFFALAEKLWKIPCRARSTLDKIQQKLKLFKEYFKGWGFNLQGELRNKRKEIQNELAELENHEEICALSVEQFDKKTWLLCENFKLLD